MSVRRVMGTEIEYGISVVGQPLANPMVASSQVVNAYASATVRARRARWDFEEESPLRDARGFDMSRQIADPTQLTDRIYRVARDLFAAAPVGPFRLIGVGISDLAPESEADLLGDLLDPDAGKRARAERAADEIRAKFGAEAIIKGRALR